MSYARFSEGDVYVYGDFGGGFVCACCMLGGKEEFNTLAEVLEHLNEHVAAGHAVPSRAFERIREEMEAKK